MEFLVSFGKISQVIDCRNRYQSQLSVSYNFNHSSLNRGQSHWCLKCCREKLNILKKKSVLVVHSSSNLVHLLKQLKVDYSFLLESILTADNLPKKILSNFGLLQMHQELQQQQQTKCIPIQFSRDEALVSFSPPLNWNWSWLRAPKLIFWNPYKGTPG